MLVDSVNDYITLRKAFGCKVVDEERYLKSFANFASSVGDTYVREVTSIEWARKGKTERQRALRLKTVVRFAQYLKIELSEHEIPAKDVFITKQVRPVPYIFTQVEIQDLMKAALNIRSSDSLRPIQFYTIIGLLASTGMRISEVLNLQIGDISNDGIKIINSKYRKSRLIPVHNSTQKALGEFLALRTAYPSQCDNVFISTVGTPLFHESVYNIFNKLLLSIHPRNNAKPRLIDFRHTFATRALQIQAANRDHVGQQILALTHYLGHAHVESTYWYLENTPELMVDIATSCVKFIEEMHYDCNSSTH